MTEARLCDQLSQRLGSTATEPYAVQIDLGAAAQALELAVYAPDAAACAAAVAEAARWLRWAQAHAVAADTPEALRLDCTAARFEALAAAVPAAPAALAPFQAQALYPLHGLLAELSLRSTEVADRDAGLVLMAVIDLLLVLWVAPAVLDWQRRREAAGRGRSRRR